MNIHPLIVHFPIALLLVYSAAEIISWGKLRKSEFWFNFKALLVLLGAASGYLALVTGEVAHSLMADQNNSLVETHSMWAKFTVLVFSLIAVGYALAWFKRQNLIPDRKAGWTKVVFSVGRTLLYVITETPIVFVITLVGLVGLTITGALGGTIVYGSENDFFTRFIYNLFF